MKTISLILISIVLASIAFAQSVDVKDSDGHTLIQINDEGTAGSIELPSVGSTLGSGKLYNDGGDLYWGADQLATASSGGSGYSIGDFAQGGIVFWLDETSEHGLVCAKTDQSTDMRWSAGTFSYTMAKGDGPFSGEMNTAIIIANQGRGDGATYAVRVCAELLITEGGKTYGDWYLPSKEELNLMYQNKATIDATATANSGTAFATSYYWSSTENYNLFAWLQYFVNGDQYFNDKGSTVYVRAIRAF